MSTTDTFITITDVGGEGLYSELRSKFLAFAHHVETVDEVQHWLQTYRSRYHDARHCCYAYVMGADASQSRAVDDGEPSSTAGRPILGQIVSRGLTNVAVFVVRYYGGVNLGTGRLTQAYKAAAADALEHCTTVSQTVEGEVEFICSYQQLGAVMRILETLGGHILTQSFDVQVHLRMAVPQSVVPRLEHQLEQLAFTIPQ